MFSGKKRFKENFRKRSISAANRRKRMRANVHKKVLWRQRTFAIREFASFDEAF